MSSIFQHKNINLFILVPKGDNVVTKLEEQITQRVISARLTASLSRQDVGERLNLGEQSYGHYERGRYAFTVEQLFQLSRILGKPVTWFLGLPSELDPDEDELLALYRLIADPNMKKWAVASLRALVVSSGGIVPTRPTGTKTK